MKRFVLAVALAACVPSPAELRGPVDADVAHRLAIDPRVAVAVDALLAKPLDIDGAIRIALVTNERLAAQLAELGVAGGELASATVLGPTQIDVGLRWGAGGHEYEVAAIQDLTNLIAMPRRRAAAHADLATARATATAAAVGLAARVELAMRGVLVAQQELELRQTAFDAADAAATLRERQYEAGGTTDLARARERDAREQARLELGRAQAAIELRRARVDALLGLSGARTHWTASGHLPDPPVAAPALDDLEASAVAASLALVADRARIDAAANRAGAATLRAVLPELGVGISVLDHRTADHVDDGVAIGPAIRIGIPLFDQHQGERAQEAARLGAARHLLAADAVELRARARATRIAALAAHLEVRHLLDVVLPLRQQIVDETLAHYNAMDADPYQLVAARRALADAGHDYLEALRRYHDAMTIATALRRGASLDPEGPMTISRRSLLHRSLLAAGAVALRPTKATAAPTPKAQPPSDLRVPNGSVLAPKVVGGVKVFHLTAESITHTIAPGLDIVAWGYNGTTPGPVLEAVEGDRVRIYVTNKLPEPTSIHWHGVFVPNGMDGVAGLTQPAIAPGKTFRYEFVFDRAGTFMYHPHADEMTQIALGMMGAIVVHPRQRAPSARDYVLFAHEWRIPIGTRRADPLAMNDFNVLTFNGKAFPATEALVAEVGDRVRIRFANLGPMDHHPMHLHGHAFEVVATDGGTIAPAARIPETTVLVPVGTTRTIEFVARAAGDWPLHCHMTHHTMNQMGHDAANLIGADIRGLDAKLGRVVPGYMTMGETGMGEMMRMTQPRNSISMLGGKGPHGAIDMGGMFTILKVRDHLTGDPGWYPAPSGSVAGEATPDELARDGIDS